LVWCPLSILFVTGVDDKLRMGLVGGYLGIDSPVTDGRNSALEELRDDVENGGGRDNCGEEKMNSLPECTVLSMSCWSGKVDTPGNNFSEEDERVPDARLEL
jgi:hypothetical protein